MATIDVLDAASATVAIEKPLAPGTAAASESKPVTLSTEDKALLTDIADAVNAPASGAATETTLSSINTKTPALGQALAASSTPVVLTAAQLTTLTPPAAIAGFSTAANQVTELASLASLDGKVPALGQALAAGSTPVVLTAAQLTTLTPPAAITGFATAAKQPAPGTAGTPSADVITVQGAASMTALKTDGSATTQPVSAASLPLPSGASTAAKQPAIGTAGTASTDVLTVQGVASMTPILVAPPIPTLTNISGTVTTGATAQNAAASNATRKGYSLQNQSSGNLWFSTLATAVQSQPSFLLAPGDFYETPPGGQGTGAISIIGATTGQAFAGREW